MAQKREYFSWIWQMFDTLFQKLFLSKTRKSHQNLGNPKGIIIADHMLKFHLEDRREEIRDRVLQNMTD